MTIAATFKSYQQLEDEDHERYLKKQADIVERRKAKIALEGFKCSVEGCGEAFKVSSDLRTHVLDHEEKWRKSMQCSQPKCGQKFTIRRSYNEHMGMHKEKAKVKVVNSIRAVLLYNKHGLLMESLEKEYRGMVGGPVPYKLLGFNSAYDLVVNMPEVVQVTNLSGGQTLLHGVPDQSTQHIAKMVGNQRSNREGFNYTTGEVLTKIGRDDRKKIMKAVDRTCRTVPTFVKKQVQELVAAYANEGGMDLLEFAALYDQDIGYPLEFECYGFFTLEDFVFHGLAGSVDIELDGFSWKMVPNEYEMSDKPIPIPDVPQDVKSNIKKILDGNPFGLSVASFSKQYEECFGQLNLRRSLRCQDLVELCILSPEVCQVLKPSGTDCIIVSASYKEVESGENSPPLCALGEIKNNIWKLLKTLPGAVAVSVFMKGYEGYYGHLNFESIHCKDMLEVCRLMPDLCNLTKSESGGEFLVSQAVTDVVCEDAAKLYKVGVIDLGVDVGASVLMNIKRVIAHRPGGVSLTEFYQKYLECVGVNIDPDIFGFSSLACLVRNLDPEMFQTTGTGLDTQIKVGVEIDISQPESSVPTLHTSTHLHCGWGRIARVASPGMMYLLMEDMIDKVRGIEEEMDKFYMTCEKIGLSIVPENLLVGLAVAALNPGLTWSRGRVVSVRQDGVVECHYVDHGYSALVRVGDLFHLHKRFGDLPGQAIHVRLSELEVMGGGSQWPREVGETMRYILSERKGRVWVQTGGTVGCRDGEMKSINQALVEAGLAVYAKSPGLSSVSNEVGHDVTARNLQRLILGTLGRIRRKERMFSVQS